MTAVWLGNRIRPVFAFSLARQIESADRPSFFMIYPLKLQLRRRVGHITARYKLKIGPVNLERLSIYQFVDF